MLSLGCLFFFFSTCFAVAVPPPSSGTVYASLIAVNSPSPVCVKSAQHSLWESNAGHALDPYNCAYAQLGLKFSLHNNSRASFNFYSKDEFIVAPSNGFGLPYGAASNTNGGSNECVVTIRMTGDFASDALPFTNGSYNTQTQTAAKVQEGNWDDIVRALGAVQQQCINQKMSGWVPLADGNIIAAMWPKGSNMDTLYNWNVNEAESRQLQESGNDPTHDRSASPA